MTLRVSKSTGQIFFRLSLIGNLSNVFLMIIVESLVFVRKTTELKSPFNRIISNVHTYQHDITVDVNLDHQTDSVCPISPL